MDRNEHLICILGEEASEIIKDCSKSLRFGLDDSDVLDPSGPTNRERLINELNDLAGSVEMLIDAGIIPMDWESPKKRNAKKVKIEKFLEHSRQVRALL